MTDEELLEDILDEVEALGNQLPGETLARLFEERARGIAHGAPGRAAWLSHAGERWEMEGDLERAKACYEEAARDGGPAYIDPRVELVNVLLELGEQDRVEELIADLRRDLKAGWSGRFVHEMLGESLELHGRLADAHRWFTAGLTRGQREDPENIDLGCLNGRYRVRRALGLPEDRYDLLAEERLRDLAGDVDEEDEKRLLDAPSQSGPALITVLYWPEKELDRLLERWPSLVDLYGEDHAEHRSLVEQRLRDLSADRAPLAVGTGSLEDYLQFADEREHDPAESSTRAAYAAHLGYLGQVAPWPPRRNDRCWCGSGRKYKACCGAPG